MSEQPYLLLPFLFLAACTTYPDSTQQSAAQAQEPTVAKQEKASPAFQPPSNADAMQTSKPLGTVKGNLIPLVENFTPADTFTNAIEYADSLDSYSLLIWHQGALRLEQYYDGYDASLKPETASMHKSVLALVVAAAIEDGFISNANARIGNYIDAWKDLPEGDITVEQLLTMSSGLERLSGEGGSNSARLQFYTGQLDARATVLGLRLQNEPGANFYYANTNSQLLGLLIEAATGQAYAEYLSKRVWQPIGADDAAVWYYEEDGFPRTYASLLARARDWLKVGLLIKEKGVANNKQVIAADLIDAMTSSSANNPNYGWQVWLGNTHETKRYYNDLKVGIAIPAKESFSVNDMIYFDGFGGQRVYISKSEDLVIVRTGNTRLDWDDSELPNMVLNILNKDR